MKKIIRSYIYKYVWQNIIYLYVVITAKKCIFNYVVFDLREFYSDLNNALFLFVGRFNYEWNIIGFYY